MYVLYVDESGSHGLMHDNQAYVLAGVAVFERDAAALDAALDRVVQDALAPSSRAEDHELHAAELRDPGPHSPWRAIDGHARRRVLDEAIAALGGFSERDRSRPLTLFAEVFPPGGAPEHDAYGWLLNRFDDWLAPRDERGLVVSDVSRRDRDIQRWAARWRDATGPFGRIEHLAEVPLFADSRASRLLQAADLVAWASWRRFGCVPYDDRWWRIIEPRVELAIHRG